MKAIVLAAVVAATLVIQFQFQQRVVSDSSLTGRVSPPAWRVVTAMPALPRPPHREVPAVRSRWA